MARSPGGKGKAVVEASRRRGRHLDRYESPTIHPKPLFGMPIRPNVQVNRTPAFAALFGSEGGEKALTGGVLRCYDGCEKSN